MIIKILFIIACALFCGYIFLMIVDAIIASIKFYTKNKEEDLNFKRKIK